MEELAKDSDAMQDVVVTLREMSADESERRLAEAREREERDRYSVYEKGLNKGLEEGREEGREEGAELEKHETARKMKEKDYSYDAISDITGLSEEEIASL